MLAGAEDQTWLPAQAAAAVQHPGRGAAVTVPGAGHVAPLLEAADTIIELLSEFWTDSDSTIRRYAQNPEPTPHRAD